MDLSKPQELPRGPFQGEGYFVREMPDYRVEAIFVNVAETATGQHDQPNHRGGARRNSPLARAELFFMLAAKGRDWRKHRATAAERKTVLHIGEKLQRQGLAASEFAPTSLGLSRSTYLNWKRLSQRP